MEIILKSCHLKLLKDNNILENFNLKMSLFYKFFEIDTLTCCVMVRYRFFLLEGNESFGELEALYKFVLSNPKELGENEEKILHTCLIENSGNIQVLIKTELEKNNILIEDHKINHVVS